MLVICVCDVCGLNDSVADIFFNEHQVAAVTYNKFRCVSRPNILHRRILQVLQTNSGVPAMICLAAPFVNQSHQNRLRLLSQLAENVLF